ncbi:MAG: hypothetical protein RLZZ360_243 [Candidatus Parcubacteria bacterium]
MGGGEAPLGRLLQLCVERMLDDRARGRDFATQLIERVGDTARLAVAFVPYLADEPYIAVIGASGQGLFIRRRFEVDRRGNPVHQRAEAFGCDRGLVPHQGRLGAELHRDGVVCDSPVTPGKAVARDGNRRCQLPLILSGPISAVLIGAETLAMGSTDDQHKKDCCNKQRLSK